MAQREVVRTTATFIVTREFDERRHRDEATRGAYLLLVPGKMPEIVLDGLATQRQQLDAEQRCLLELSANATVDRLEGLFKSRRSLRPQVPATAAGDPLGLRLAQAGLVSPQAVAQALARQEKLAEETPVRRVGSLLIEAGVISMAQVARALGEQRGMAAVTAAVTRVDPPLRRVFPLVAMLEMQAVPLFVVGKSMTIAMADPQDEEAVEILQSLCQTGHVLRPLQAPQLQVHRLIESTRLGSHSS